MDENTKQDLLHTLLRHYNIAKVDIQTPSSYVLRPETTLGWKQIKRQELQSSVQTRYCGAGEPEPVLERGRKAGHKVLPQQLRHRPQCAGGRRVQMSM